MATEDQVLLARRHLASARNVTILTGAGISADSGVPTFRGTDGLWRNFRAEDLATAEAFERNPQLVWEWYNWRREILATKQPNEAHHTLVRLEERLKDFHLITQNVDGLHRLAGSRKISELHGDIWKVRCTSCRLVTDNRDVPLSLPPHCRSCRGLLRPHIVWFGEALDEQILANSFRAAESCNVMIIVGTSGLVYPAAMLMPAAKANGAFVIEINLDSMPDSPDVALSLQGRAKDVLPLLL